MTKCEKFICDSIYDFISEKWDRVDTKKCEITQSKEKFLKEVRTNFETACWVLTEVMDWAMDKNIFKEMIEYEDPDGKFRVFKLGGEYIKIITNKDYTHTVSFATPKRKTVIYFE